MPEKAEVGRLEVGQHEESKRGERTRRREFGRMLCLIVHVHPFLATGQTSTRTRIRHDCSHRLKDVDHRSQAGSKLQSS